MRYKLTLTTDDGEVMEIYRIDTDDSDSITDTVYPFPFKGMTTTALIAEIIDEIERAEVRATTCQTRLLDLLDPTTLDAPRQCGQPMPCSEHPTT